MAIGLQGSARAGSLGRATLLAGFTMLAVAVLLLSVGAAPVAAAPCDPPIASEVACENTKPGNPASEWDVSGSGDANIQGFTTDISVDQGQTVQFKVDSVTTLYRLDIYRMGYYGGSGARKVATVRPSGGISQQPGCVTTAATGLVDCGNWAVSASWAVPTDAVSGIYFAKLVREDGPAGSSHVAFVVRDDDGASELLFQTADTTWQAYNQYGGNSLYTGSPAGRAYKVSYNRPFTTRGYAPEDWVFNAEYPMVRWLERNGYDVSYFTGIDSHRYASELLEHETFLSVGHDEYWSGGQRANVEAARAAGVNLAFFSGNEVFWKTRWENSNRTLVSYKETHANAKIDPSAEWTGTWRDPRFSPPADGGRPENALTGQLFMVNAGATTAIQVPAADGKMRFWRNTSIATQAAGATATLPNGTLGYEWDEDPDNGHRPAGSFRMSSRTVTGAPVLVDYGSNFGSGTATHNLTLYKGSGGGLVFGAGTVQWSWGLDNNHDRGSTAADARMQQATANLLADMRAQPATLQTGLVLPSASTDSTAPSSNITSPAGGANVNAGQQITITGTATDGGGGVVGGVEVSVDGGATWHPASGRASWSYNWTPTGSGTFNIRSRAVDDSANRETPSVGVSGTIGGGSQTCPCSIWNDSTTPANETEPTDTSPVELGVKFRPQVDGQITGLRFFKGTTNTGTHVGHLWSRTGTQLAEATFTNETARGWQQVSLSNPVNVTAGTTYVASYHAPVGRYAWNRSYFATAGFDSGPLRALADGEDGGNGVYAYGPSRSFPSNTYLSENYWVDVVFQPGTSSDTTPPTVTGITPASGATSVSPGANITGTFSEPMNSASINGTNVELRGPGGTLVNAALTYDTATRTATLDPANPLADSTTYTATIKGGPSGVKDVAGNPLATDRVWTFTTAAVPPGGGACPCSIWNGSTLPANEAETSDTSPVELGVKFRADVDGQITGLRFYKGTTNTGTHVGRLWSRTGTQLAQATFTNETPRGWQEVTLSNPVAVTAGTTYIASYHAPVGNYAFNSSFFATSGVDNPPLRALANGEDGGNGVYRYGPSGSFPDSTFGSTNYWVDVVFQTNAQDTTPPTITDTSPLNGATGVAAGTNVRATFSEAMDAATINGTNVELRAPGGALVPASVSYDAGARAAVLDPTSQLSDSTTYTATVKGGTSGVKDRAGNALASDRTWTFTTAAAAPPPPDDGPGGPVLAISSASNPFSRYYSEILRAEGLNAFTTKDISTVTSTTLTNYDVVILGEMALTPAQVSMLTDWVTSGGNLIAMRPDKQLSGLLGLVDASSTLSNAYLSVNTSSAPGAGIVDQTVQFHGTADRYATNGATTIATLFANAGTSTPNPAVTMRNVGSNGGQAAAFTFDLARSIVYTRQGNPDWSGQERDGFAPIRSDDLFFGGSQPNWVDLNKVAIPQADELQRLLANTIGHLNADRKPLPRFWYLPRGEKAAVVMTGDDHGSNGTTPRFNAYLNASPPGCSVADWECVRGTSYIYPNTPISDAAAAAYVAQGFEVGLHVNTNCGNYTPASIQTFYADQLAQFANQFPSVPAPRSNRTHCIAWSDWASQAKTELQHGIRFDTNYYYWPPGWVNNVPGNFTGSAIPMRFADLDGTMIDVYQAVTQMTDESGQSYPFTIDTLLDRALGSTGYYGVFTANMHTDFDPASVQGSDAIVASALSRGVPVVTSKQMLDWVDGRNNSSFGSISWANNALSFNVNAAAGANGLRGMLPTSFGSQNLTGITRSGSAVSYDTQTIKGVQYAIFPATTGAFVASYGGAPPPDTTPPAISSVTATATVNGTATVNWTTNEASSSRVDYGTSPAALGQSATGAANVTSHSVQLTGLTPGATYHYRVRSADAAGNEATSPAPPAAPASFVVPQTVNASPAATVIQAGTLSSGNAAALATDDNVFFAVNSTTTGTRTSDWYGSFTGVTNALSNLRVAYTGKNSVSCTQTVAVWRWTTNTWVQVNSGAVGTTEIALSNLAPSGAAANYVSGTTGDGEVRVRVRCTRATNFLASGDFLRISFQR